MIKKIIFWLVILSPAYTLAAGLQVDLPEVGGVKPTESFGPGHWIQYIFVFALSIVGLAVIAAFVWAGIEWLTAGDSQSKVSTARGRMWSAVQGLIILLGSYIILYTINPDLVNIREPSLNLYIESHWRDYFNPESKRGIGGYCEGDGWCTTNKCNVSIDQCVVTSEAQVGTLKSGDTCSVTSQCLPLRCLDTLGKILGGSTGGATDSGTGKCSSLKIKGEGCDKNEACYSQKCTSKSTGYGSGQTSQCE